MPTTRPIRYLFATLGVGCVALGAIGVFVPGLPTTVFLIAASYLFIRSCPVLEERLIRNSMFRPYLRYVDGEPMPRSLQSRVLVTMWGAVTVSLLFLHFGERLRPWLAGLIVAAALSGTVVILRHGNKLGRRSSSPARGTFNALQMDSPSASDQSRR